MQVWRCRHFLTGHWQKMRNLRANCGSFAEVCGRIVERSELKWLSFAAEELLFICSFVQFCANSGDFPRHLQQSGMLLAVQRMTGGMAELFT